MNRYKVKIEGFIDYDMMPRVRKVILVGMGHFEDYEVEFDEFDISIKKIHSSEGKAKNA